MSAAQNHMRMEFPNLPENVAFARTTVAVFASQLDFTLDELDEIKVATSEAVSNTVIHAYGKGTGMVTLCCHIFPDRLEVELVDGGIGIEDVDKALEPAYTTVPEERMGLGLVFINEYMDVLSIESKPGQGTKVHMVKYVKAPKPDGV